MACPFRFYMSRIQSAEAALRPSWSAFLVVLNQLLMPMAPAPTPRETSSSSSSLYADLLLTSFHEAYEGDYGSGDLLACCRSSSWSGQQRKGGSSSNSGSGVILLPNLSSSAAALHSALPALCHTLHLLFQDLILDTLRYVYAWVHLFIHSFIHPCIPPDGQSSPPWAHSCLIWPRRSSRRPLSIIISDI